MAWFKVDDNFYDHPKVDELSLEAVGLWTLCGTYAARHLTDGFIPHRRVTRLGGDPDTAAELVDAELWEETDGGYTFLNWHDYQPTKNKVESRRETDRDRKRKQRRNKTGQFEESAKSHAVTPSGIPEASQGPSHTASRDSHNTGENQPSDIGVTELDITPDLSGFHASATENKNQKPRNHAEQPKMSEECHTVTPDGHAAASHPESHRPDPTRPDPSPNTLSLHAVNGDNDEKESTPEPKFSQDVTGLADYLADWIVQNGNRKPNVTKTWLQAIDRLIRIDGYTPDEIRQVIDWSQRDEFWQDNILSAGKLRKQFDQLKNRMFKDQNRYSGPAGMAPGSQRALNTLQLGQALQAAHDHERNQLT